MMNDDSGNVANVAKKAKKPDVEKAYEELFKAGTFATAVIALPTP